MKRKKFSSIDQYIRSAPKGVQTLLRKVRSEIKKRIPSATEVISYNMPAFSDSKTFVYFATFKNHLGIYPPLRSGPLRAKLKPRMNEKGNLAFSFDQKIPLKLIGDIAVALWKQSKG